MIRTNNEVKLKYDEEIEKGLFLNVFDESQSAIPKNCKYFGMIIDKFYAMTPEASPWFNTCTYERGIEYCYGPSVEIKLKQPIPFIFTTENKENNPRFITDILSGIKIRIGDWDDIVQEYLGNDLLSNFEAGGKDYLEHPLCITYEKFYAINEAFAKIYRKELFNHEKEMIKYLYEIEEKARGIYKNSINKEANNTLDYAYVDCIIDNYEKKLTR